jgi:hypothetical protein
MYGGGIAEVDRYQLRERIRHGEVSASTEIAPVGTDEWRQAASYPELARYLELAAASPGSHVPLVARDAPTESVASRIGPALRYPISGGELVVVVGLAILQSLPGISLVVLPVTTIYMLAIIRASSEGKTKMPAIVETDDVAAMFAVWIRTVAVTVISLWPMLVWFALWYFATDRTSPHAEAHLIVGLIVTGLISLVYYPACLAMIAVWDSVVAALNPVLVARTIRTMGSDYATAVLGWAVATGLALLVAEPLGLLPFVGGVLGRALWIWAQFFGAHLLGWAIYRHSVELGWN